MAERKPDVVWVLRGPSGQVLGASVIDARTALADALMYMGVPDAVFEVLWDVAGSGGSELLSDGYSLVLEQFHNTELGRN